MDETHTLSGFSVVDPTAEPVVVPRKESILKKTTSFLHKLKNAFLFTRRSQQETLLEQSSPSRRFQPLFRKWKGQMRPSVIAPIIIVSIFILTGLYLVYTGFNGNGAQTVLGDEDQRVEIQKAKAEQSLNKRFLFPLRDNEGKEVSKIQYIIEEAELRDQIVVKGKRATSVKGRTFLIINLKITNDFNQTITLNTKDYVRLIVNNSKERLAPDIHNDPVEIQPISTKYTRLGFPINDTDKNLVLQVGEIAGSKQTIKLNVQ